MLSPPATLCVAMRAGIAMQAGRPFSPPASVPESGRRQPTADDTDSRTNRATGSPPRRGCKGWVLHSSFRYLAAGCSKGRVFLHSPCPVLRNYCRSPPSTHCYHCFSARTSFLTIRATQHKNTVDARHKNTVGVSKKAQSGAGHG